MRAAKGLSFVLVAFAVVARAASEARAEPPGRFDSTASLLARPHTIAELELGGIILPTAAISPANRGGNLPSFFGGGLFHKGDATMQTGLHLLYRAGREFAVGASALFAPNPNSEVLQPAAGESVGVTRTHTRSYLSLGVEGRYYPVRYKWFEGWIGLTAGAIMIADRFEAAGETVPVILGTRQFTQRTEGGYLGVAVGANYLLTDSWVLGLALRATRWILPMAQTDPKLDPACSSFNDCPTITGTTEAFEFGLSLGFRIPL